MKGLLPTTRQPVIPFGIPAKAPVQPSPESEIDVRLNPGLRRDDDKARSLGSPATMRRMVPLPLPGRN